MKPRQFEQHWYTVYNSISKSPKVTSEVCQETNLSRRIVQGAVSELIERGYVVRGEKGVYSVTRKRVLRRFSRTRACDVVLRTIKDEAKSIRELADDVGYSIHYLAKIVKHLHETKQIVIAKWNYRNLQKERCFIVKSDDYPVDAVFEKKTYKTTNAPYANRHKWKAQNRGLIP